MKHYFIQCALWMATTLLVANGVQAQQATIAGAPMALKVELLLFSGRPNPTFVIADTDEVKDILGMAKALPQNKHVKAGESGLPPSKLGYQGFIVINATAICPEIKSFTVSGPAVQLVVAPAPGGATPAQAARIDSASALESKLLAHVKSAGLVDDKLLEIIQNSR